MQKFTTSRSEGTAATAPTAEDLDRIPAVLKARPQWVLWRGADRVDKDTGIIVGIEKVPINPHTLYGGSTTDSDDWGTFDKCVAALPLALEEWEHEDPSAYRGGGIGYVFTSDDPYTGVDLDHCRDPHTGVIADWAQTWIDTLNSYTQGSVSGTGVHSIVEATLPPGRRQSGNYQMWDHSRFFAMTGWHIAGTPPIIEPRQIPLTALWCTLFAPKVGERVWTKNSHGNIANKDPLTISAIEAAASGELYARFAETPSGWPLAQCELAPQTPQSGTTPVLDDTRIIDLATQAQNGAKFAALWRGDWSSYYRSQSEADLGLLCILSFWTQDPDQLDRLFRQSGLMREKWDKRPDYRKRTMTATLTFQAQHYTPPDGVRLLVNSAVQSAQHRQNGSHADLPSEPDDKQADEATKGPRIYLTTRMMPAIDQAIAALLAVPGGPAIYQRGRTLCHIARGVKPTKWMSRPPDAPTIAVASPHHLQEQLSMAALWMKEHPKKPGLWVPVIPPMTFIRALQDRKYWPSLLLLEGIVCAPTLRPDGSVLDQPGYDCDTGLWYDSLGEVFPAVKDRPGLDDARSAIGQLQEAIIDFRWAEKWHFSAALAAILSVVCRYTIMGNVPLFGIRAPVRGSGKTMLADVISLIGTGRAAPKWPQVTDEEEERKRLLTLAMDGDPVVLIDNVDKPLGSAPLAAALTADSFKDRILGKHESKEAPMAAVFFSSGNNTTFRGDVARRVVPIDLDPQMEKPEERSGFCHTPLMPWVKAQRPTLVTAALTLLKAYFAAECPRQPLSAFGSFEAWSTLIRSCLVWAGEADPCEGRKTIEADSNPEFERLAVLLESWHTCYPPKAGERAGEAYTLKHVFEDIGLYAVHTPTVNMPSNKWNNLRDALTALDPRYDGKSVNTQKIGEVIRGWQARIIDNKRLVKAGTYQNAAQWRVDVLG
jgi:hypothetical protein